MRTLFFIAAAATLLTTAGCVDRQQQKQAKRTQVILGDQTKPVSVMPVSTQTISETLEITGDLTTAFDATISSKASGRLVAVYVNDGDFVKAGQVVAVQETENAMTQLQSAQSQVAGARAALNQAIANAKAGPLKSSAALASAQAQLRSARAQLQKAKSGARPEERQQAESSVNSAKSALDTAKKELDRQRELEAAGASSRQRREQAENAYQAALSAYESARSQLSMMENWSRKEDIQSAQELVLQGEEAVKQAKAQKTLDVLLDEQVSSARAQVSGAMSNVNLIQQSIRDAQIKSPFAGRISGKPIQAGEFLPPGGKVARVIGLKGLYLEGQVPESEISSVHTGSAVAVNVGSLGNKTFAGKIVAISPLAQDAGRLFNVRVQIYSDSPDLKPGMFARGIVNLRSVPGAVVVPTRAIVDVAGEKFVYVIQGDTAKKVPVKTGLQQGENVQVSGIKPGDSVVIQGQAQLSEGAKVKIEAAKVALN